MSRHGLVETLGEPGPALRNALVVVTLAPSIDGQHLEEHPLIVSIFVTKTTAIPETARFRHQTHGAHGPA